ncbi:hypothetical protein IQ255_14185 [Pleurocapsales cyanobacterium LEGE 10410]|nr:hypothetical protein [Pleurocapsales cyanobacterium LEGE 10410]
MVYTKRKNNRIQDPNQINYVKSILEASAQQCQQGGMYTPEIYIATAQRIADTYSLQDSNYPRVTFNSKEQTLKGQNNSVPELTASIGDRTSTSYFLIKDSLPQGTTASPEQLTHLRPDIVSARIATNLGIVQPPLTTSASIPPINQGVPSTARVQTGTTPAQVMAGAMPTSHAPSMSKAQAMAQTVTPATTPPQPPISTPNSAVAGLAALAAPVSPQANNHNPPAFNEEKNLASNNNTAPIANQIPNTDTAAPPVSSIPNPQPIHDPQIAKAVQNTNQNLQTVGNLNQNIGKALKDMAKGEVNPIQLYGDTLNVIGSFINGIPAGIQEARLKSIAQQMKLIEEKKKTVDLKMDRLGDDFITSGHKPPVSNTDVFNTSVPKLEPELYAERDVERSGANPLGYPLGQTTTAPANPTSQTSSKAEPQSQPKREPVDKAIDKLLKSSASIDDKLNAIEKTLDKMLEELIKIEKNLEAIQASLESKAQATDPNLLSNPEDMVVETEAKTEVEIVANNPMAEVPVRTEIETDIIAEAKTETEATEEVEVTEVTVDLFSEEESIPQALASQICSYEGNLDLLNQHLASDHLKIELSEDASELLIGEINNGVTSFIFAAEANEEGWNIQSEISEEAQLDILDSFVKAELAVNNSEPELQKEVQKPVKDKSISLSL